MNELEELLEKEYPLNWEDFSKRIHSQQLRVAFTSGVIWALTQWWTCIPPLPKGEPASYAKARVDIMESFQHFRKTIFPNQ